MIIFVHKRKEKKERSKERKEKKIVLAIIS